MAELVDALVSNTSGSDAVPVRSRLRVLQKPPDRQMSRGFFISPAEPGNQNKPEINCSCCFTLQAFRPVVLNPNAGPAIGLLSQWFPLTTG